MLYESESHQIRLRDFCLSHCKFELVLDYWGKESYKRVGGLGECDGDEYRKLAFGHLSLAMTLSRDTE